MRGAFRPSARSLAAASWTGKVSVPGLRKRQSTPWAFSASRYPSAASPTGTRSTKLDLVISREPRSLMEPPNLAGIAGWRALIVARGRARRQGAARSADEHVLRQYGAFIHHPGTPCTIG